MRVPLNYYQILGIPPTATDSMIAQAYQDRRVQLPRQDYSEVAIQSRLHLLERAYRVLSDPQARDRDQQPWFSPEVRAEETEISPQSLEILDAADLPSLPATKAANSTIFAPAESNVFATTEIKNEEAEKAIFLPMERSEETRGLFPNQPLPDSDSLGNSPNELEIDPEHWVGALMILHELGEYGEIIQQIESRLQPDADQESSPYPFISEIPHDRTHDVSLSLALAYREISREQWQHQQYESAAQSGLRGLGWLEQQGILLGLQAEIRSEIKKLRPYRILELIAAPQSPPSDRQRGLDLFKELLHQRRGIDGTGDDGSELNTDEFILFIQQIRTYLSVDEQLSLFEEETHRPSAAASYLTAYAYLAVGCARKQPEYIVKAHTIFEKLNFRKDSCIENSVCALLLGQTDESLALLRQRSKSKTSLRFLDSPESDPDLILQDFCIFTENWLKSELFPTFQDLAFSKFSLQDYFADQGVQDYLEQYVTPSQSPFVLDQDPIMAKPQAVSSYGDYPSPKQRIRPSRRQYARQQTMGMDSKRGAVTFAPDVEGTSEQPFLAGHGTGSTFIVTESLQPEFTSLNPAQPWQGTEGTVRLVPRSHQPRSRRKKSTLKVGRVILVAAIFLGGLGTLGWSVKWVIDQLSPLSQLEEEQLFISMNKPVIEVPPANVLLPVRQEMTPEYAQQLIQTWLASKADAFGEGHQSDRMATILDNTLLPTWKKRADNLGKTNAFCRYQHSLEANSLKIGVLSPNQARVDAIVREKATYLQAGKEQANQSYDDTLRVRYGLVRKGDRWLIQSIQVLESL